MIVWTLLVAVCTIVVVTLIGIVLLLTFLLVTAAVCVMLAGMIEILLVLTPLRPEFNTVFFTLYIIFIIFMVGAVTTNRKLWR